MNLPGLDKPSQPLTAIYGGAYVQDVWRPKSNLSVTAGLRFDVPVFENTAYLNPNAERADVPRRGRPAGAIRQRPDARTPTSCGRRASASTTTSPAIRRRSSAAARACSPASRSTSGSPISSATPACCRETLGRHGVESDHGEFPFSTNVERYKPAPTGQPAASYELNVTDNDFRFPQVWRSNIAVDRRLPGGITGTAEFIYNRDVNGIYYINANLPAAQHRLCRRRQPPALDAPRRASTTRPATRSRGDRPEEPGHRPQLEPRLLGVEADVAWPGAAHRL